MDRRGQWIDDGYTNVSNQRTSGPFSGPAITECQETAHTDDKYNHFNAYFPGLSASVSGSPVDRLW